MFRTAHRQIYNLIVLNRYDEAEKVSRRLGSICRAWQNEKVLMAKLNRKRRRKHDD